MLFFDCNYHGISYNVLLSKGKEDVSADQLCQELAAATSAELVGILPAATLLEIKTEAISLYTGVGTVLLAVILVFAVIGLLDNLFESYRERREEFALYLASGMSRQTARRMKAAEIQICCSFALLAAAIATAIGTFILNYMLSPILDLFTALGKLL